MRQNVSPCVEIALPAAAGRIEGLMHLGSVGGREGGREDGRGHRREAIAKRREVYGQDQGWSSGCTKVREGERVDAFR
jgi:hypothetical protein